MQRHRGGIGGADGRCRSWACECLCVVYALKSCCARLTKLIRGLSAAFGLDRCGCWGQSLAVSPTPTLPAALGQVVHSCLAALSQAQGLWIGHPRVITGPRLAILNQPSLWGVN